MRNTSQSVSAPSRAVEDGAADDLARRSLVGIGAVTSLRVLNQVVGVVRLLVLARFVAPADFGLFAATTLVIGALSTFSEIGVSTSLVQSKRFDRPLLDTGWTLGLLRAGLLTAIAALASEPIARAVGAPEAAFPLQVVSLSVLISSLANIGTLMYVRELSYSRQVILSLSNTIPQLLVGVVLAVVLQNVWALVLAYLAGLIFQTAASYLVHSYRPRLVISPAEAGYLLRNGKWLLGGKIVTFVGANADNYLVSVLLGPTQLGLYTMAYRISSLALTEIAHVLYQVTFPLYSRLQDQRERLGRAYIAVLTAVAVGGLPLTAGIAALGDSFVELTLGPAWLGSVPVVQSLALLGFSRAIGATYGAVFLATGHLDQTAKVPALHVAASVALAVPMTAAWGLVGVVLAFTIPNVVGHLFLGFRVCRILGVGRQVARTIAAALGAGILMAATVAWIVVVVEHGPLLDVLAGLFLGGVVYLLALLGLSQLLGLDLLDGARQLVSLVRARPRPAARDWGAAGER